MSALLSAGTSMQPRDSKLRLHFALVVAIMVVLGLAHSWVNP